MTAIPSPAGSAPASPENAPPGTAPVAGEIERRTLRSILLFCVPLVVLTIGSGVAQYAGERDRLLEQIARQVEDQGKVVSGMLTNADRHMARMREALDNRNQDAATRLRAWLRPAAFPLPGGRTMQVVSLDAYNASPQGGDAGNLIGSDAVLAGDPERTALVDAALGLMESMRLEHRVNPSLHLSYFFSAGQDFITLYPAVPAAALAEAAAPRAQPGDVDALLAHWLSYDVFTMGSPAANPSRAAYWTRPYEDAAGGGRMISHAAPIDRNGRFAGIVGTDILLSDFAQLLEKLSVPIGMLAVLDPRAREVIAGRGEGDGAVLAGLPATLTDGFVETQAGWILVRPLGETPFRLVHLVTGPSLHGLLWPRFLPNALILVALGGTVLGLILHLRGALVQPGLALAAYIRSLALREDTLPPVLPRPWHRWRDAIGTAFASHREAEARLRENEARYRAVVNTQTEFVTRFTPDGVTTFANSAYRRYLDAPPGNTDALGLNDFDLIHPDDRERHDAHLTLLTPAEPTRSIVFRAIMPNGKLCWEEWTDTGLFDASGRLVEVQAVGREVTEKRRAEEALRQSEKLAALGSMLAGVAHELNNPLSIVVGYAGMLKELSPDEATRRRAGEIHTAAERCARIVRTFLAMARAQPARRSVVDLDEVVLSVTELAAYGLRTAGITVEHRRAPSPARCDADADQIHQVLMNLVVNAQQAMMDIPGPRRLTVVTAQDGDGVVVSVEDTGIGMSEETRMRAFEPFFTTKPQGVGTGIGLSVSLGIVESHGGTLTLGSRPGAGTVFRMRLPALATLPDEACVAGDAPALAGQALVVDDEPAIADLVAHALEGAGITVVKADGGRAALRLLAESDFDLMVTDLRMPDMDGMHLIAELTAIRPEMAGRVILMTGDALRAGIAARDPAIAAVLEKPIDPARLTQLAADVLKRGETSRAVPQEARS